MSADTPTPPAPALTITSIRLRSGSGKWHELTDDEYAWVRQIMSSGGAPKINVAGLLPPSPTPQP